MGSALALSVKNTNNTSSDKKQARFTLGSGDLDSLPQGESYVFHTPDVNARVARRFDGDGRSNGR